MVRMKWTGRAMLAVALAAAVAPALACTRAVYLATTAM